MDTQELTRAHEGMCAIASTLSETPEDHADGAKDDPTPVAAHLLPALQALAGRLGFAVLLHPMPTLPSYPDKPMVLGETEAPLNKETIELETNGRKIHVQNMSPASTFRTMCHEVAHAIRAIERTPQDTMMFAMTAAFMGRTPPQEELIAESTAGLVTAALGCTDGRYTTTYLRNWGGGSDRMLEKVRSESVALAERILKELGE
jgi:hypothetical protein